MNNKTALNKELPPQDTQPETQEEAILKETPLQRFWSEFSESRIAVGALVVLIIIVALAALAPWITPQNPYDLAQVDVLDGKMPPGSEAFTGYTMWLGSDGAGRDLYSAILYGIRISLTVGLAAGFIALIIGTIIGLIAAYAGGRVDAFIMRAVDIQLSFPAVLIALVLVAILGEASIKLSSHWLLHSGLTMRVRCVRRQWSKVCENMSKPPGALRCLTAESSFAMCCRIAWHR